MASESRQRAQSIATALAERLPEVEGICLFGSVARGDDTAWSDLDLMVVGSDAELTPTRIVRSLPEPLRDRRLSVAYYALPEMDALIREGSPFVIHLTSEGQILFDRHGKLREIMSRPSRPRLRGDEIAAELDRLRAFEDVEQFNDDFLFGLARLYSIGKSVVMMRLVQDGTPEFNRDKAFETLREHRPELEPDLRRVQELRPFHDLATRRHEQPLPFSYWRAGERMKAAIAAIRAIAAA